MALSRPSVFETDISHFMKRVMQNVFACEHKRDILTATHRIDTGTDPSGIYSDS